jgi:hypothetical protein
VQREREEEQMLGICTERERERKNRSCARGERFFFMNKQMLWIATVLPNTLGSTVAIPGNI